MSRTLSGFLLLSDLRAVEGIELWESLLIFSISMIATHMQLVRSIRNHKGEFNFCFSSVALPTCPRLDKLTPLAPWNDAMSVLHFTACLPRFISLLDEGVRACVDHIFANRPSSCKVTLQNFFARLVLPCIPGMLCKISDLRTSNFGK